MIHKIVSIYDVKSECFGAPVFVKATGEAIRSFGEAVNDDKKENNFAKWPADFSLFLIGEFDDSTGEVTSQPPEQLVTALSLLDKEALPSSE